MYKAFVVTWCLFSLPLAVISAIGFIQGIQIKDPEPSKAERESTAIASLVAIILSFVFFFTGICAIVTIISWWR